MALIPVGMWIAVQFLVWERVDFGEGFAFMARLAGLIGFVVALVCQSAQVDS